MQPVVFRPVRTVVSWDSTGPRLTAGAGIIFLTGAD